MSNAKITGQSMVYGVMGDPVGHSLSPQIHNLIACGMGHPLVYVPFHVDGARLGEAISGGHALRIQGMNVTIPHKRSVMPYLCDMDQKAKEIGSVNTLKYTVQGYVGYNTDHIGLARTFGRQGYDLKGKSVVVLGAGGSAYAACVMAASHGAKCIYIVNRSMDNAERLAVHLRAFYETPVAVLSYERVMEAEKREVVIQTTSLGFGVQAEGSPIDSTDFFVGVDIALDIIYHPWETVFLRDAKRMGVVTANGFDMLVYQAAASYEIWRGITLDEELVEDVKRHVYKDM